MSAEPGETAPDITLPDHAGETFSLADEKGHPVVLFFYPKDNTPGCTVEAKDFSALVPEFAKLGVTVIGVSPDSQKSHANFRSKKDLSVRLLSDADKTVSEAFGVWQEKSMYGRKFMGIVRSTFLIDADGKVARAWRKVKVANHAEEVLEAAREIA